MPLVTTIPGEGPPPQGQDDFTKSLDHILTRTEPETVKAQLKSLVDKLDISKVKQQLKSFVDALELPPVAVGWQIKAPGTTEPEAGALAAGTRTGTKIGSKTASPGPNGSISNPDGSITNPDGSVTNPDGSVTNPNGSIRQGGGRTFRKNRRIKKRGASRR